MGVELRPVTRENWQEAMEMRVNKEQKKFVPEVVVSLAKIYIKPDGDHVTYIPYAIYDNEQMVGFIMHAYESNTTNMYWINGFLIDVRYQGKGYGRKALMQMVNLITSTFPKCEEIRLTVHKENRVASKMYLSLGFISLEEDLGEESVLTLRVK
ncbi:GNAT family N-acetyltransferase [Peribacillus sp. SCS-155]|uniref:GNAT family N-acetyltransferase n=1 Tax=Peribacillus sedimenti TaxID=3115297 RepID=UPI003906B9E2